MTAAARGPVQVTGEVLSAKRVGAHVHLTLVAPGVAERFRPGTFVALAVGGPLSDRLLRRTFMVHRVRPTGAYGGTVEVVVPAVHPAPSGASAPSVSTVPARPTGPSVDPLTDVGTAWLAAAPAGTPVDVVGPLGRPFALPKEPVTCLLVGEGGAAAPLFALAERLRERRCVVHMLLGAPTEPALFGVLEARRTARTVVVVTEDGSVGMAGRTVDVLPGLLARTDADVVYACGPLDVLHAVAAAAEEHGAWSQTAVVEPMPCGTGVCHGCALPVVGEDGVTRMVRACVEGPVFRGDRVRWADAAAGRVPEDAWGASAPPSEDRARTEGSGGDGR